nr:hypothetical protein [Rhodococcus pyridinivorans]
MRTPTRAVAEQVTARVREPGLISVGGDRNPGSMNHLVCIAGGATQSGHCENAQVLSRIADGQSDFLIESVGQPRETRRFVHFLRDEIGLGLSLDGTDPPVGGRHDSGCDDVGKRSAAGPSADDETEPGIGPYVVESCNMCSDSFERCHRAGSA